MQLCSFVLDEPKHWTPLNRSELAFAESQILEIQKELDAHKQECYGHMKVIQEMRFGKMQASQLNLRGARFKFWPQDCASTSHHATF